MADSVNLYERFAEHYNHLMLGGYYDYAAQAAALKQFLPHGATVLEIGVGTGLLAKELVDLGYPVTGVDHTEAMLVQARDLLGPDTPMLQADVTDFDLGTQHDVIISNGGVWYGVHDDDGDGHGYCGHLPTPELVVSSLERVAAHTGPSGMLVLSLQDRHHDKKMDLPDGVTYRQQITPHGEGAVQVFQKEYIFEQGGNRVGYESLDLAYIDSELFEGTLREHGFGPPQRTADRQYVVFSRG